MNAVTGTAGVSYTQSKMGLGDASSMEASLFKNANETIGQPELLHMGLGKVSSSGTKLFPCKTIARE